ncbi:Afadin [Gryllus bimaculatus]|nr:Afadin [Gryllus bimaculatus]
MVPVWRAEQQNNKMSAGAGGAGEAAARKQQERESLRGVIQQWNANRLDLFELSEPNEELEFHGVMRFYFQDSGQKVATKCIRVASDAPSQAVIETLIEKFRPDMRML